MATNTNLGMKRTPAKTYSAFNALPTLRGKENKTEKPSPERKFKRPPQFADQLLFPGRRLDRRQQSILSGYSGKSLDIETIVSGGRPETSGAHSLLSSAGFTRSLNDVNDQPWEAVRQLPSAHSHMTLLSRQSTAGPPQSATRQGKGGLLNTFPGASLSMGNLNNINVPNAGQTPGGFPVSSNRWKHANFSKRHQTIGDLRVLEDMTSSPDSSYSSESVSESSAPSPQPQRKVQHAETPLVPKVQLHRQNSNASSTHYKRPDYLKKANKKQSDKPSTSPTPQLDKILWALVPDEFANISDTGVSEMEPGSTMHDSASSRYVTFTDLENGGEGQTSRVPNTPRRPILTEEILSQFAIKESNDDRIMQWLAECDEQSRTTNLPTHLPDISYTFKYVQGTL